MRTKISGLRAIGLLLFAIVFAWLAVAERNNIFDWWRLHEYTPPAHITALAGDDTMTAKASSLFYVNHPQLESSSVFNKACPPGSEHTIVLGCYHPVENGIFLYTVTDSRLAGVEQVTAAHEMLHAAYDRLDSKTRNYVDGLLENYYQRDLHDPTILAEIAAYKKSEPHDVVNEMHSVFGTEVANLPAPLEAYYRQYFSNRKKITQYTTAYRSALTSREAVVKRYDVQLSGLKSQITNDRSNLGTVLHTITDLKAKLAAEQRSATVSAYNNDAAAYNVEADRYNNLVSSLRNLINQYNQTVSKRNALALEENHLSEELDSTAKPIQP
jgi:hypothetical protein